MYPGHFLHYQHLRRVESKARKSTLFAPTSCIEGWAHYCEAMMIEAGFGRQDPGIKLGQLAEALVRLARFVVCIRLHAEDWSVEQGVRFFRDEAFMEEGSARREAERGTFDPMYPCVQRRETDPVEAAQRLQTAAREVIFAESIPRHAAGEWHRPTLVASRADVARRYGRLAGLAHAVIRIRVREVRTPDSRRSRSSRTRYSTRAKSAAGPSTSCNRRRRFSSRERAGTSPTTRRAVRPALRKRKRSQPSPILLSRPHPHRRRRRVLRRARRNRETNARRVRAAAFRDIPRTARRDWVASSRSTPSPWR